MLRLYYAPHTCALATHIVLEEARAAYDSVRLSFASEDQKTPEYAAINPKARVPALVTDHGVLTETPAILAFVAQSFPAADLAPADPFGFAEAQAFNSYLCSTVHVAHAHRMRGYRWAEDQATIAGMQKAVPRAVTAAFRLIETDLLKGPWVLGERFSVCDPYLFTLAQWLELDGVDPGVLPRVVEHRARVAGRAATKRAITMELEGLPA
jgi:glutathione S-transferase